jgi:uncharacterized protein YukE
MADGKILVTPQRMRETAQYVRERNTKLNDTLNDVRAKILETENHYKSEAADEVRRKIAAFSNSHFNQFREVVESYATFLVNTADMTEGLVRGQKGTASSKFQEG